MIPFLNKGPTGHGGAKGEIPDRYAGFQTFMSAAETSPFIKVFYGISRHKTIKSGDLLVKERNEKSLFHVDPFYSYSTPEHPLRHFSRIQGILDKHCACMLSCSDMSSSLWPQWRRGLIVAHQTPLPIRFFRQEYWSGLLSSPPGDLPNPETEPMSLMSPALASRFFTTSAIWEVYSNPPFIDKEN